MTDRWNSKLHTVDVVRPPKFFVPADIDGSEPTAEQWAELEAEARAQMTRTPDEWAALREAREAAKIPPEPAVKPRGKTWGIRERGDLTGTVVHSYRCPVHGLFDVDVPRASVPEEVPCRTMEPSVYNAGDSREDEECGHAATWAGSFCGQGHAAGETCS